MRIEIENLTWAVREKTILSGVALAVESGEFVSLLGPNGCGKTSLLRCLYRMQRPDGGRCTIDGVDVWATPPREVAQTMAVLTQLTTVEFDFTVTEMVAMGRIPHRRSFQKADASDQEIVAAAVRTCRLTELAHRSFATLSGGERQRVLIARAVAQRPRVLVMDEPTNHLDIRSQVEALRLVRGMGVTVLSALHDLNLASRISDRVVVMSDGAVVADGPPDEVLTGELVSEVYGVDVDVFRHPRDGHTVFDIGVLDTIGAGR